MTITLSGRDHFLLPAPDRNPTAMDDPTLCHFHLPQTGGGERGGADQTRPFR